jgi:excinuclease ABC subunit A
VCEGRRFNRETLQVRFKDKNIREVLEMDVQEALEHFADQPRIRAMLQTLHDVGLDYLKLGQPSPTLSGGEAQRIKLARELCRRSTGQTLYVLDEPTTGLHFDDISKLLQVLHGFVEQGNTVVVIEHNLDVLKTADWLIDLGPDGGAGGGQVVAVGTPDDVAAAPESYTGQALRPVLAGTRSAPAKPIISAREDGEITHITVQGANEHNLKNVSVSMPREAMTVCCGPSGSGKSTLAIDTIYAEGQRRYVESLSAYARQFLGQMQKPKVEHVSGLSPAISIEQKTTSKSPRSTVGTVTEIYDYLRILYARLGQPYCPKCQIPIGTQTADEIIDKILTLPEGAKLYLMAPIERHGQEKYDVLWDEIRRSGFVRMRVDKVSYGVEQPPDIDHRRKHQVEVIVDRVVVRSNQRGRIADAVEAALDLGRGVIHVAHVDDKTPEPKWRVERYSQHLACDQCGRSYEPLHPQQFSFNSPLGWCPACEGLGFQQGANPAALFRDPRLSIREGAIAAWPPLANAAFAAFAQAIAVHAGFSLETPYECLEPRHQRLILHGTGDDWIELPAEGSRATPLPRFQYKGLFPAIDEATRVSHFYRFRLDDLVSEVPCSTCDGSRLRPDAAAVRFLDKTIGQIGDMPLAETSDFFKNLKLAKAQQQVAGELLREIRNRLQFLVDVGLEYLTLNRAAPSLSGGEAQRIRLASQIGSGLTGVLYVLDEPTIGLHPRDNRRLIRALEHLRDLGNTLLLVEHDREVIDTADYLLDFGPGAGDRGGEIVAQGTPKEIRRAKSSLTGQYLSGKQAIPVPTNRRIASKGDGGSATLTVKGARHNNLQNIDVSFPLGAFIVVTGVSGSGKSSLVNEVLYNTLARKLHRARTVIGAHDEIVGLEQIDKVINVDQSPIGNSPSSNPATYTGVFDLIRQLFSQLPDAKIRGYHPRRFSFNKPGGRCEACEGMGQKKIEMHFLPDVWVECDVCHGTRYSPETLLVRYKEHNISDVLKMRVSQALEVFANIPKIRQVLQTLSDVGLDYLALGQSAPTLSGGEAQRVKLAAELARPSTGRTVYILDEPTTGLHFDDIRKLLDVLNRLVDLGNTVIVVEHNLDVIKTADWIIDLGPEAGAAGGRVVASGTPEEVVTKSQTTSHTAAILAEVLSAGPHAERPRKALNAGAAGKDDIDLDDIGQDAQMPWQRNGRRWHAVERISRPGRPCRWEGAALEWVVDRIGELGEFSEPDWNDRSVVEVAAKTKSLGWFLHAHTNEEWLLWLAFRVGRNTFKATDLKRQFGLRPAAATPGLETSDNSERVRVKNERGPWQSVAIGVHSLQEIDTPAFREFLTKAVAAFQANLRRMQTKPEDVMPWKINGERWHLSDKGFPIGKKVAWERGLLKNLLSLVREVATDLEIHWNVRDHITLRPEGASKIWARWKTKLPHGLECFFLGKKGQFNLARLESFGAERELITKLDCDVMRFLFRDENDLRPREFKQLLIEQVRGFLERFR